LVWITMGHVNSDVKANRLAQLAATSTNVIPAL
jgi:hypothetical protein